MNATPLLGAAFVIITASAADSMKVVVCDTAQVDAHAMTRAQSDAAYLFNEIGVQIAWVACGDLKPGPDGQLPFILRMRRAGARSAAAGVETMGMAYVSPEGRPTYADVYVDAVLKFAASHDATADDVLGYAIAHELGHLLLGPRHAPTGLMSGMWRADDVQAMRRRALHFTITERAAIHRDLLGRAAGPALARRPFTPSRNVQ